MANSLITNQIIAREAIPLFKNRNGFVTSVKRQYQDEFAKAGGKVGTQIRIRQPVDYVVRRGPTAQVQNTIEPVTSLTVANQAGVDMSFSTADRTMVLDRFVDRYVKPAMNRTVGALAVDLMNITEGGVSGFAASQDPATGALQPPNMNTWLLAQAALWNNEAPSSDFKIVLSPNTNANTVASLAGLFNSQLELKRQYESGSMFSALGFDWMADQTVITHVTGSLSSATPVWTVKKGFQFTTVNGAGQGQTSTNSLAVSALTGTLAQGDIITIDGVFGVNATTGQIGSGLRHFTVTAACPVGAVTIPIAPALTATDLNGLQQPNQTVSASPANGANVYSAVQQNVAYKKNIAFDPAAFTMAVIDLDMPNNVDGARRIQDDVSVRVVTQYAIGSDQEITRLDILYGMASLKPQWAVVVPDPI